MRGDWNARLVIIWGAILCLWGLSGKMAEAASFDCAKASKPIEKVICGHPELSELDTQLSGVYTSRRQMLEGADAQALVEAQRAWLAGRSAACGLEKDGADLLKDAKAADCLADLYRARVADLSQSLRRQIAASTTFHPDFWGLDMERTFPQLTKAPDNRQNVAVHTDSGGKPWIWRFANGIDRKYINKVNGDVIILVSHVVRLRDGSYKDNCWRIDVFQIAADLVENCSELKGVGADFIEETGIETIQRESLFIDFGHGYILEQMAGHPISCETPFANSLALFKNGIEGIPVSQVWPIVLNDSGPVLSGGTDCEPPNELTSYSNGVELPLPWHLLPLPDGTFLAWNPRNPRDIIRFDRRLRTPYHSSNFLLLDGEQWRRLPKDKGDIALEHALLSLFDHGGTLP